MRIATSFSPVKPKYTAYSFYGRMLALAQVEGMMTVVDDEIKRQMKL